MFPLRAGLHSSASAQRRTKNNEHGFYVFLIRYNRRSGNYIFSASFVSNRTNVGTAYYKHMHTLTYRGQHHHRHTHVLFLWDAAAGIKSYRVRLRLRRMHVHACACDGHNRIIIHMGLHIRCCALALRTTAKRNEQKGTLIYDIHALARRHGTTRARVCYTAYTVHTHTHKLNSR